MNKLIIKSAAAYKAEVFIAGDLAKATEICQTFCERGLCVTIEPTNYVFTGGQEMGVRVGLINYARFPKPWAEIWNTAIEIGHALKEGLDQGSFTVQDKDTSVFFSTRDVDQ